MSYVVYGPTVALTCIITLFTGCKIPLMHIASVIQKKNYGCLSVHLSITEGQKK